MKVIYDTKTDILTIILKDASVTESDEDLLDAYPNLKKRYTGRTIVCRRIHAQ